MAVAVATAMTGKPAMTAMTLRGTSSAASTTRSAAKSGNSGRSVTSALTAVQSSQALATPEIVIHASDVVQMHGNWTRVADSSAAGGRRMSSIDYGWSSVNQPLAAPADYFDVTFVADANTPFHVWFRLEAQDNSKWNDSIWAQFSDAVDGRSQAIYRIGTSSGLLVNLAQCAGCGLSGWGWQDGAYWLAQTTTLRFASSGMHTLRVQTREDGVQLDQIVLSSSADLTSPPGAQTNDTTIVPAGTSGGGAPVPSGSGGTPAASKAGLSASGAGDSSLTPYLGYPISLPGTVQAANFDDGGEGVAYHDSTPGNLGGAYRSTDVDIQPSSTGGYNVGWTTAGEWLNYSVAVAADGDYTLQLQVATPYSGQSVHIGFAGPINMWTSVPIPSTGDWQTWTTVNVPATLGAGFQIMTVLFDTGWVNLEQISVAPAESGGGGNDPVVVTWNIEVEDDEDHSRGAIDLLMGLDPQPQVVVLEEASTDQVGIYIDELQNQTGQTWYGAFQTHCPLGAWDGDTCTADFGEGVGVFSIYPIIDSGGTWLPYPDCYVSARGAVRATLDVNGVPVQVFGLHLQTGNCTDAAQARYDSMSQFKDWASQYSTPQLVAGDFNADPDQIDSSAGMSPDFIDSWSMVGGGNGHTAFTDSLLYKLDYWFFDASWSAIPLWSWVVTDTGTFSDHFPLIASFSIGQ
jgi:endonuclease/exonuclease/phosphatase family metal-dependent hydrolase